MDPCYKIACLRRSQIVISNFEKRAMAQQNVVDNEFGA